MFVIFALLLLIVVAGLAGVRLTHRHPLAVAAAIGLVGAVAMAIAMVMSVPARADAVAITGGGTFVGVGALALVGALIGAWWRRRARSRVAGPRVSSLHVSGIA